MADEKDPTERDHIEDEDLEMDAEEAEDVKGGALVGIKLDSTVYSKTVKDGNVNFSSGTYTTTDPTSSTQPLGSTGGAAS